MLTKEERELARIAKEKEEQLNRMGWFKIYWKGKYFVSFQAAAGYRGTEWRDAKLITKKGYVFSRKTRDEIRSAQRLFNV